MPHGEDIVNRLWMTVQNAKMDFRDFRSMDMDILNRSEENEWKLERCVS